MSKCRCFSFIFTLSLLMLVAAAVINVMIVNPDRTESQRYQWRLCNTTAFSIDPSDLSGVMTFHSNTPFPCEWNNYKMFVCNGNPDTVRCVIENTNLYNNNHWYCMLRCVDEQHVDCSAPIRFNQPDYVATGPCVGMILLYVFGAIIFLSSFAFEPKCCNSYTRVCE
jgi:hypothetical protein